MAAKPEVDQGRELWLAERKNFIGGSEAFELLNIPTYGKGCCRALFYRKSGVEPDYPEAELNENLAERGNELEQVVAEKYSRETGRKLRKPVVDASGYPMPKRHASVPGIGVHTDRHILADGKDVKSTGDLEIKTHGTWPYKRLVREGVTSAHLAQIQHSLAVTGHKWGALAILCPDLWEMKHFDVPRDEGIIKIILTEGERFWNAVEKKEPPPQLPDPEDQRCKVCAFRLTCRGQEQDPDAYAQMLADKSGKEAPIPIKDEEIAQLVSDYQLLNAEAKDIDSKLGFIETRIAEKLNQYGHFLVPRWHFYWKVGVHSGMEVKRHEKENPECHAKFYVKGKPNSKATLRIYPAK